MKKFGAVLAGIALSAAMLVPALADEMRARIKAVDQGANTVTVIEGGKDYSLAANADTKFLNVKGAPLADGIKSADLRQGRRVIVNYDNKDGKLVLASLQIRP